MQKSRTERPCRAVGGRFVADIRYAAAAQRREAEEKIRTVAAHSYLDGSECGMERISFRVAMEACERNSTLLARMNEIYAQTGLPTLAAGHSNGGSDAADACAAGLPAVDSLGVRGGRIHSVQEYAELASLTGSASQLAA